MPMTRALALFLAMLCLAGTARRLPAAGMEKLWLGDEDRLLVLAPHPDDETLSAGGLIQEALDLDLPVEVCFFTMGDNHEIAGLFTRRYPLEMPGATRSMGTLRRNEAIAAAIQLGLRTNDLVFLGYPDSGTLDIWSHHWRDAPPLRSVFTQASAIPFSQARSTGAPYSGESILRDLTEVIREFRPTHIVLSHSADHDADHRALALFTRVALWNLAAQGLTAELLAAPIHFTQWPEPRKAQPQRPVSPPYFLDGQTEWIEYGLAPYQISNKVATLRRYHSQTRQAPHYLDSFIRKSELFGDYPELVFPGGTGAAGIREEDDSQFRPDDAAVQALARHSPQGMAIAEQQAAETRALQGQENDFRLQTLVGDGTGLTLSFQFSHPLSSAVTLTVSLFAYQADQPFGPLPKLHIEIRGGEIRQVEDLDTTLPPDAVRWVPGPDDTVSLRVPFALLGNPDKILASARLSKDSIPIDWTPWRILDFSDKPFPEMQGDTESPEKHPARPVTTPEASPAPPPAKPAAASRKPQHLVPRVRLPQPRQETPDRTEADEPVRW